ncbi:hypothetical protein WOLCODRAFT_120333 [Wolfiporia cocos MD-104 SS10]|uniref:Alkyl hydroperoxide reductase subunit C/ Thiol specific antioxidant domain-containing protein n=1 Tax=Wolfiporia cocos (strain MD-104) TaxID=742152 RepID=A0A2H3K1P3_WOLCO|nr:hypothetical protein WOLCODRAFT_120333 [Wolfiporia cocos MD-104 SS10]
MPTKEQIRHASSLVVVQQNGVRKQFGDLFTNRKTIVIFIRHFWCPADQDYMYSIAKDLDFESLKQAGIGLVIIGLGSPAMIKSYKQIFRMPFEVYTDPTLRLHSVLGMTRRSQDLGNDVEKGEYIRHGALSGLAMVVRNAIRVGMPVWEKGGDVSQLGGEFVLGPGYSCSYTHRMRTARSHVPILHVLALAGVHTIPLGPEGASRSVLPPEDEEEWLENRRRSYMRMQARREKRREHDSEQWGQDESREDAGYGSDVGSGSVSGHWGSGASRGADVDVGFSSAEDDVPYRRERRRPVSRFRVANPDPRPRAQPRHHQYIPPTSIESESTPYGWEADVSDLPYIQDDSYRLTDVLSYPYGDS